MRAGLAVVLAVAGLAAAGARSILAQEVPPLSSHVNDYADMIGADAQEVIDARLAKLEADTGAQVVVLTVPSLEGGSLEEFTLRIAETWQLGREDTDDGLLIFVARDDRKIRLEVGYGLEGPVPDALANRIIDERMAPAFRNGDFEGGIASAAEAVEILVRGEDLPPPETAAEGDLAGALIGTLVLLAALAGFLPRILAIVLYALGAPLIAIVTNGTLGTAPAVFLTVLWLVGFPVLRFLMRRIDWSQMSGPGGGVWHTGGGGSGGGWGGGFSGGGGSFGGGGASGGW